MKRLFLTTLTSFAILTVVAPTLVFAQTKPSETPAYQASYVPCGTDDVVTKDPKTGAITPGRDDIVDNPCGFGDVITMAKRLITGWIIAGVTFATMGFAYAGLLYITAMGSAEKISHAHSIFTKTALGFVFMLSAWLIAYALESAFLTPEAKNRSFLQPTATP